MMSDALLLALLVPATGACLYYFVPTVVGRRRLPNVPTAPAHTFAVLIPAHDEEACLPATLGAVAAQDYPPDLVRVYVVADNCSDRTASVAAAAGMTPLVRDDPTRRGKGHALRFGLDAVLPLGLDAVVILDADCLLGPNALRAFDSALASGAEVVQAAVRSANPDDGHGPYASAIGDVIDDAVAAGRDRLGLRVPLRGTGMAFRLEVLVRIPWSAFGAVEDAEYADALRAAGVRVGYCRGAAVVCATPVLANALHRQRRRWRAALLSGGRWGLPGRLVRSKPLVLGHLVVTAAICGMTGPGWAVVWAGVLVSATATVYALAVAAVGLTWRRVGLLAAVPWVVARLGWITAVGLVRRDPGRWERPASGGQR